MSVCVGVNLLIGTESGLMLLDRSGIGKGLFAFILTWSYWTFNIGFVMLYIKLYCEVCWLLCRWVRCVDCTAWRLLGRWVRSCCACSLSVDLASSLHSDGHSWGTEHSGNDLGQEEQDPGLLPLLAQIKDTQNWRGANTSYISLLFLRNQLQLNPDILKLLLIWKKLGLFGFNAFQTFIVCRYFV